MKSRENALELDSRLKVYEKCFSFHVPFTSAQSSTNIPYRINPTLTKSPSILIHFDDSDDGAGKFHFLFAHHMMVQFLTESKLEKARIYLKSHFCHVNRQMHQIEGSLGVFF